MASGWNDHVETIKMGRIRKIMTGWKKMSWWNSIEILHSLSFHTAWIAALAGIIAAVLAGVSWIASTRADTLEAERSAATSQADAEEKAVIKADIAEAKKRIPETVGEIVAGTGDSPKFEYGGDKLPSRGPGSIPNPELGAEILLGDAVTYTETFPFVIVAQGDEDVIVIDRDESGWLFSGKFFNESGKIVCEFVKNQYHLHPANHFRVDKAPNRLTVYDDEANQVFDVEFINPKLIRLTGSFCVRGGERVVIESKTIKYRGMRVTFDGGRILGHGPGANKGRVTVLQLPPLPCGFGVDNIPVKGRAFLTIQGPIRLEVAPGQPIDIAVGAKNLGDLPAMVRGYRVFFAMNRPVDDLSDTAEEFEMLPATLFDMPPLPNGQSFGGPLGRFQPLTSEMVGLIYKGLAVARVFGTIWYTDEKGTCGESIFCGRLNPRTNYLEPEEHWNRML
jgi:hypothetical protein